jgi:hypothetical protein
VPATGWVTELDIAGHGFDRQQTSVLVMREASGAVVWLTGGTDG